MANIDNEAAVSSSLSGERENTASNVVDLRSEATQPPKDAAAYPSSTPTTSTAPSDSSDKKNASSTTTAGQTIESPTQSTRPSLVQLGSGSAAPTQTKRFSAVNINKKFLEKTSTTSPGSSSSGAAKIANSISRNANTSASTIHPRLITTKLTANPQSSSSPGPGWSRPSSVTPPVVPNSNSTTPNGTKLPPQPNPITANTLSSGAPQIPPTGKLIQPQPRSAVSSAGIHKTTTLTGGISSNKPVWGNAKAGAGASRANSNDFPTAAEVALGVSRPLKSAEPKESDDHGKQARMEDADTFRGVHLDPNAHHWDEMEEDDDNFLDGVIEFGDGRQYKVDNNPTQSLPTEDPSLHASPHHDAEKDESGISNVPVSKEERFVDDFDRSWPRTAPSISSGPTGGEPTSYPRISPSNSHSGTTESSKALFNERSNRLEPYSSTRPTPPFKRGQPPDHSPIDSRGPRPPFSHAPGHQNVQLLQKPPNNDGYMPDRRYSGSTHGGDKRRDGHYPVTSPHSGPNNLPHSTSFGPKFGDGIGESRGRQQTAMGPPPVPPHALRDGKDAGRQLPPHLSQPPLTVSTSTSFKREGRAASRESRYSAHSAYPTTPSVRAPSQSPSLSHASAVISSPVIDPAALNMSTDEFETAKKDWMHGAAERAKQRRLQEEEEREREKERARQKAAELEKRFATPVKEKSAAQVSQSQSERAIQVIEQAIKEAKEENNQPNLPEKPSLQRTPSFRTAPSHPPTNPRRVSFTRAPGANTVVSAAPISDSVNSWRTRPVAHSRSTSFTSQPPSALEHVESLADDPEADLEIVDYSELGKFVGVAPAEGAENADQPTEPNTSSRRAVASDFFEDQSQAVSEGEKLKSGDKVWRRKERPDPSTSPQSIRKADQLPAVTSTQPTETNTGPVPKDSSPEHPLTSSPSHPTRNQRKEAPMSALDDAMSRVKEALDGMQSREHTSHSEKDSHFKRPANPPTQPKLSAQRERRAVPSSRPPQPEPTPTENFLFTSVEPPRSPPPAWNQFLVRVPKTSAPLEPIHKRQLERFKRVERVRWWEVLSFNPPVEGMNRRDFSLNDVLFRRGYSLGYKGNNRYRVSLPHSNMSPQTRNSIQVRMSTGGAFGRPTVADEASTWRKRPPLEVAETAALSTTSRSPPPEPRESLTVAVSLETSKEDGTKEQAGAGSLRTRSQPKMPVGSGVAFYRDSRIVEVDAQAGPAVSFFAVTETDSASAATEVKKDTGVANNATKQSPIGSKIPLIDMKRRSPNTSPNDSKYSLPPLVSTKTESKSSEDSPDRIPITPPSHHNSAWPSRTLALPLKDSPVRVPDPEHLRAVWSQTSNKSELHPVNSLEGIADDLTALPFTLQDVKSEDGETPPPTMTTAPSRMSLHDVTKAFQQVPVSSLTITPHRPTISPPSTSAPVARPPQGFNYSVPNSSSSQNMRPNYPYHPSPIMSHSPAPMAYPHPMNGSPVPSRMQVNGHAPLFSPMWVPHPNAAAQSPGAMRPAMPYPPPPMYPSPGPQPIYGLPPNMQNSVPAPQPPQQGGHLNRGRGNGPIMSPAMAHTGAVPPMQMYGSSPVMLPAHAARPPMRNDSHPHHHPQHPPPSLHHPMPPQSYPSPAPFGGVRPTW
ncbi:hypothetical protein PQX77_004261 [Marasmius sp. AFHP31]|nr:hypothetical protein PQX77_004261 [Marasmius sp. AFHP31]